MSDRRNELLLCALKRFGEPATSADIVDVAAGLASAEGWAADAIAAITRNSVAKRLEQLEQRGLVRQSTLGFDGRARRTTPRYEPVDGWDPKAPVPPPPGGAGVERPETAYDGMSRPQLLAVLETHDEVIECVGRFLTDMRTVRERAKRRLIAVGLEG